MAAAIEVSGLSYTYPDGTPALNAIDLKIKAGETVGLLGPNGAGKSTLMLHLNGILGAPGDSAGEGSGTINVLGLSLDKKNLKEIRAKVGLVFQDPEDQLFLATVFDDVAFGPLNQGFPPDEVKERVKKALAQVEMLEAVSKSAHHLSLGEKKRVALATVLSMDPEILVIDEPTSNLDPRSRRHLIKLLKTFKQTMLIATHDMDFVWSTCQRAVILDAGRIVADGPVKQLLADQDLLESHGLELPSFVASRQSPVARDL